MARVAASVAMAVLAGLAVATPTVAIEVPPNVFCGPPDTPYRCGAILVILEEDTRDTIADVIGRMGGNPETDVLQHFTAVRDLLDSDGVADQTAAATVYQVAVPQGQEQAWAGLYATDPAVYAASVDRETVGRITPPPDTAIPDGSPFWPAAGAILVVFAAILYGRRARRLS